MASILHNITFDAVNAPALARFWAHALGWNVFYDDDPEVLVAPSYPWAGPAPSLLFIPVPEPRTVKNRVHLDIQPSQVTRDEEVTRLIGFGASIVEDHRNADGTGWVWMADPEGNDFCVERGTLERAATTRTQVVRLDIGD